MKKKTLFFIVAIILCLCGSVWADNATGTEAKNSTLILYYSKMGTTRIVADELSTLIPSAELEEIKSDVGIMKAVLWHQLFDRNATIEPIKSDPSKFDHIILCSPIWFQNISSPARTIINTMPLQGKTMQLFITYGNNFGKSGQEKLKKLVISKGVDLKDLYIVKTGDKSEKEIRRQTREQLQNLAVKQ